MAKITAPVADFSGTVAGVTFDAGTGETDNEGALAYFQRQGYTVEGASDDDGPDAEASSYLENVGGAVGTPVDNPPGPLDAADPDNDLVPVGGVKSAASPGMPEAKSSRGKRVKVAPSDQPADITPTVPVAAQDNIQSASSATPATTPSAAPVGDDTAPDVTKATPAPDPTQPAVSANVQKDAAVQDAKDTTSDAAAPDDTKGAPSSPTGASAAADTTKGA